MSVATRRRGLPRPPMRRRVESGSAATAPASAGRAPLRLKVKLGAKCLRDVRQISLRRPSTPSRLVTTTRPLHRQRRPNRQPIRRVCINSGLIRRCSSRNAMPCKGPEGSGCKRSPQTFNIKRIQWTFLDLLSRYDLDRSNSPPPRWQDRRSMIPTYGHKDPGVTPTYGSRGRLTSPEAHRGAVREAVT